MTTFKCEKCKKEIIDTPEGYITECPHYPFNKDWFRYTPISQKDAEKELRKVVPIPLTKIQ